MDKLWTDAEMAAKRRVLVNYMALLSVELEHADAGALSYYYLSQLRAMKILVAWEDRPRALFDAESKRRCSQGDTAMTYAAWNIGNVDEDFRFLVKRARYDRVADEILVNVAIEYSANAKSLYMPKVLREWMMKFFAGLVERPANEERRIKFLRNVKIVKLLNQMAHWGIPPTHNVATAPGQYRIDIAAKLMNLSHHTIATVWKDRYRYWDGPYGNWNDFRRVFDPGLRDISDKVKNGVGGVSYKNEESTLMSSSPSPYARVFTWLTNIY